MPHKLISGIYVITCVPTGKVYVGSAASINLRWCEHKYRLKRGKHHSQSLQNAWGKYGPDAFSWAIVEVVARSELTAREQFYIDSLGACDKTKGFNLFPNARRTEGYKHSEETRAKIRTAKRGMKISPEHAEALHASTRGKKQSPEFIEKRVAANRGKKRTPEQRARFSLARKEDWRIRKAEAARLKAEQRAQATFLRTGIKPAPPEKPKRETQGKLFD